MAIHFSPERWEQVRETFDLWWHHRLDRPILQMIISDAQGPRPGARPVLSQANCNDLSLSADDVVESIDDELSRYEFLGDSFPSFDFSVFGPGVVSAFCGARLDNRTGRVWFFPPEEDMELQDIHIRYDPENLWVRRIKDIYEAGYKKWQGQVLMGMPDLGGILDIAAVFRGTENLLCDLYDEPEEVHRICKEIQTAWLEAYRDLNDTLTPLNPGYTDWLQLYSDQPGYVIQSDFSCMISQEMFREFDFDGIRNLCRSFPRPFYHLDGEGAIKHLDRLLTIPELQGIQWVPGDGKPHVDHWLELYDRIHAAGKLIDVVWTSCTFEEFDRVSVRIPEGLRYFQMLTRDRRSEAIRFLQKYGVRC